jgi:hypothetical protein
MSAVALTLLALLDGALLGFRAAAGRTGLVHKPRYFARAIGWGVAYTSGVILVGVLLTLLLVALRGPTLYPELLAAAAAGVRVFAAYASLVVTALLLWIIPSTDLRTFCTVTVLGPGTLARPFVIVAGLVASIAAVPRIEVVTLGAYGAAAMLVLERVITARHFPVDEALVA